MNTNPELAITELVSAESDDSKKCMPSDILAIIIAPVASVPKEWLQGEITKSLPPNVGEEYSRSVTTLSQEGATLTIHENEETNPMSETVAPAALDKTAAAQYLGITAATLNYLVRNRKIRYVQVGKQRGRVFRRSDLDDFLQDGTQPTAEEMLRKHGRR